MGELAGRGSTGRQGTGVGVGVGVGGGSGRSGREWGDKWDIIYLLPSLPISKATSKSKSKLVLNSESVTVRGLGLGPVKNHEENDLGITKGVTPVFREICERQLAAVDLRFTVLGKSTNWKKSLSFNCSSISRVVALPKCMSDKGFLIAYRLSCSFLPTTNITNPMSRNYGFIRHFRHGQP